MKHVMVDLETLGNDPASTPVLAIGAVRFDVQTNTVDEGTAFYRVIDLKDALSYGRVDSSTLKWWLKTDNRDVFFDMIYDKTAQPLGAVLQEFRDWVNVYRGVIPWSKGIDFDFPILERLFKETEVTSPFAATFWKKRDVRTLVDTAQFAGVNGIKVERDASLAHNARSDAIHQAKEVVAYLTALSAFRS